VVVKVEPVVLKFGGGINSRTRLADLDSEETSQGENFDLDVKNSSMRPRKPFAKIVQTPFGAAATATGTTPIKGYAQIRKRDGTVDQLIQCASVVYNWNGATTFSTIGETSASDSQIRGGRDHNFQLATYVIITDLKKQEDVAFWDGATATGYQTLTTGLTNLKAKYCRVVNERVVLGNLKENSVDLPHMTVFSQVSTATTYSVSDRPSSALGLSDAVYLLMPDLKQINGMEIAFGNMVYSTENGRLFLLNGSSSFDFAFTDFYYGSNVKGDEAIANIGNDVVFGRTGAIDVLRGVIRYGDVAVDDTSRWLSNSIERTTSWTIIYDQRHQRVYCFPNNQSAIYVLHKDLLFQEQSPFVQGKKSPWSKWVTNHDTGFSPTTVWSMTNPIDGYDSIYFGDADGNIYLMDADDVDLDAGTESVVVSRRSPLITVPEAAQLFDIEVWVDYTKQWEATLTLNFLFGGEQSPTETVTLTLPGSDSIGNYYNSSNTKLRALYNSDDYYRAGYDFTIRRQNFNVPGHGNFLQVEAIVTSAGRDWQIEEIGLRIHASA
jgi:hypothetical protein